MVFLTRKILIFTVWFSVYTETHANSLSSSLNVLPANYSMSVVNISTTPPLPPASGAMTSMPLASNVTMSISPALSPMALISPASIAMTSIPPASNMMSMPMAMGSCMIVPSTCICDPYPTISVMSTLVSMPEANETVAVNMTMTSSVNISGSLTSYMAPANISISPSASVNMTMSANQSAAHSYMASHSNMTSHVVMASQSDMASHSVMATHSVMECQCIGRHTACYQMQPTPIAVPPPGPANTDNGNENLPTTVSASYPVVAPSVSVMATTIIGPTTSLDTAAIVPSSTMVVMATSVAPTLPPVCVIDCEGTECGSAIMNGCGLCVEGNTGLLGNHGKDCNNVCNGTARNDSCNACTNPPANDPASNLSPFMDCNGTCFGSAVNDSCGECSGGDTGKVVDFLKDACGVCGGDNSTCVGCDGVPNSGKVNDSCGVCGGDGSSCTTISMVVPSLLPTTSGAQSFHVYGAGLTGDSIKCLFDGVESAGTLGNLTYCQCETQASLSVGVKSFTVIVVKSGVDTQTANLTITIYDAAAVKVTGLQPSEMFTKETTAVTFGGSGFVGLDSSAAVCVINATKVKAVLAGASYTCTLPEFSKSVEINLTLSLNGIHELVSDVSLARIVYARAPTLTKAQFSDTGALIDVEFDKDVDTTTLTSCSDVFISVSLLGTSPVCSWSDGRHLTITPGASAQILPGATLTLKANAVKCGEEQHSKYAAGSVTVGAPTNPAETMSVIVGPTQISSCGHLSLDGSQSSGGGGRNLKYTWSLVGSSDVDIIAVLDLAKNKSKVFVNGTLMTAGTSYTIKLVVENFLGSVKENTIVVTKASEPLPEVTVDGPLNGKTFAGNSFYITAVAKAASCSSTKALTYTWTVDCASSAVAKTRAESSSGFQQTSSKYALKIDAGSLVGGKTYEFTVVVALEASPSTATTMETTVMVDWSPLEPAITGGDRTLGRGSGSHILDAESSTVDPDNADGDLSCSWICTDLSNQQPCYSAVNIQNKIVLPNQCVVTVPSNEFAADKSYKITSQVSKGSRTGSSSIVLTVVEGNPPAVSVLKPSIRVVASETVSLQGKYNSSIQPTKVEWMCAMDPNYYCIDLSNTSLISSSTYQYNPNGESFAVIVLKANVLTPGASYKFILNVDDGSKVGSSNMVVEVRSGPTSGTFDVSPTNLQALETVTLTTALWVTDTDAYPLQYEFGFVDGSGIFQPWITQASNEYSVAAPPGPGVANKLTLRMKVMDAFGSMKWMEKDITVNPVSSVDEGMVQNTIVDWVQQAEDTGDYSTVVPNLLNILAAVAGSTNPSASLINNVTNSTVNALIAAVDATSLDQENAQPILKTFLQLDTNIVQKPNDLLDSFQQVMDATNGNLDASSVKEVLKWMSELASEVDLTNEDVLKDIQAIDDEMASSLAKDVGLGQPAVETTEGNSRAVIRVEHSFLLGDVPTEGRSDAPKVTFGEEMQNKLGFWECAPGKFCLGAKVKFINYKEDYISGMSSNKPNIVTDEIVSISLENPETGAPIPISGLTNGIDITFETGSPSADKTFVSYYYNEATNTWSNDGLTSTMQGTTLKVTTNHLTSFAPAEEYLNNTNANGSTTATPTLAVADNVFLLSLVLSNTTWDDDYLNSSHPQYDALKTSVLNELSEVYKNDPTLKNINFERFEKYGDVLKAVLKMTFAGTNNNPSKKLLDSLANGQLGSIAVDKNSVQWVNAYAQSEVDHEDDTDLIIGTVFGVFFGLATILLLAAWLKKRQSRRKIGSSPSVHDELPEEAPANNDDNSPA